MQGCECSRKSNEYKEKNVIVWRKKEAIEFVVPEFDIDASSSKK